nr:MAG TPA: hypothetical protein [Caudoviricetes sp.]
MPLSRPASYNSSRLAAQVAESNRIFQDAVNQQLVHSAQAAGLGGSQSYQEDSAFEAKYAAFKAYNARIRAEIEAE